MTDARFTAAIGTPLNDDDTLRIEDLACYGPAETATSTRLRLFAMHNEQRPKHVVDLPLLFIHGVLLIGNRPDVNHFQKAFR